MNLNLRISPPPALTAWLDAWLASPPPPLAVEIAADRVVAARSGGNGSGSLALRGSHRELPAGAVAPSAVQANITDPEAVTSALRSLLDALDGQGAEVALLVPDLTARVSIIDFDSVPARRDELDPLVRFRLRKTLPFDADQMALSCQLLPPPPGQSRTAGPHRVLVALADRVRLDEYENCLEAAGALPVLTLPSGLAALAAHPALADGALLIRAQPGSLTTAFCVHGEPDFFRVIATDSEPLFEDVFPSVAFFRDRWDHGAGAAAADRGMPTLFVAGLPAGVVAQLADEAPWAQVRAASAREDNPGAAGGGEQLLAVAGALRGRFS